MTGRTYSYGTRGAGIAGGWSDQITFDEAPYCTRSIIWTFVYHTSLSSGVTNLPQFILLSPGSHHKRRITNFIVMVIRLLQKKGEMFVSGRSEWVTAVTTSTLLYCSTTSMAVCVSYRKELILYRSLWERHWQWQFSLRISFSHFLFVCHAMDIDDDASDEWFHHLRARGSESEENETSG